MNHCLEKCLFFLTTAALNFSNDLNKYFFYQEVHYENYYYDALPLSVLLKLKKTQLLRFQWLHEF